MTNSNFVGGVTKQYNDLRITFKSQLDTVFENCERIPGSITVRIAFVDPERNFRTFRASAQTRTLSMIPTPTGDVALTIPDDADISSCWEIAKPWMTHIVKELHAAMGMVQAIRAVQLVDPTITAIDLWYETISVLGKDDQNIPTDVTPIAMRVYRADAEVVQDHNVDLSAPYLAPDVIEQDMRLFGEGVFYDDWDIYPDAHIRSVFDDADLATLDRTIPYGTIQSVFVNDTSGFARVIDNKPPMAVAEKLANPDMETYGGRLRLLQLAGGRVMVPTGFFNLYKNPIRCGILRMIANWHRALVGGVEVSSADMTEIATAIAYTWPGARAIRFWYATPVELTDQSTAVPGKVMPYGYTVIRDTPKHVS